ncbi:MAG: hypothetical protein U0Q16_26730 [Bryobacteraceae bacterium]
MTVLELGVAPGDLDEVIGEAGSHGALSQNVAQPLARKLNRRFSLHEEFSW